jgi:hypothetical protein
MFGEVLGGRGGGGGGGIFGVCGGFFSVVAFLHAVQSRLQEVIFTNLCISIRDHELLYCYTRTPQRDTEI